MSTRSVSDRQFETLENLSKQLSNSLSGITDNAQNIIQYSLPQIISQSTSSLGSGYYQLGTFSFDWKLYMEQRNEKVIFFFRRKSKNDNSLKTEISFNLVPTEIPLPSFDLKKPLSYWWAPPPFLELDPPKELVKWVKKESDKNTPDNVLWIGLGKGQKDLMAIGFHSRGNLKRARFYYFKNRSLQGAKEILSKKAPLYFYTEILNAIRPWILGKTNTDLLIKLEDTDIQINKILKILSENFIIINRTLAKSQIAAKRKSRNLADFLTPYYQVANYASKILLRLNAEERISTAEMPEDFTVETLEDLERNKLDLFQFEVQLKGIWQDEKPAVRFKILPPDFLVEGDLFQAFFESILNAEGQLPIIAAKLNTQIEALEKALKNPPPNSFIFRIGKFKSKDSEMIVLPIIENEKERFLMFSAEFEVDAVHNEVLFRNNSVSDLLEKGDGQAFELKNSGVKYFVRLLIQINKWKNKVY